MRTLAWVLAAVAWYGLFAFWPQETVILTAAVASLVVARKAPEWFGESDDVDELLERRR